METWTSRHGKGDMETWKWRYVNMEKRKQGGMETCRYADMERLRNGDMEASKGKQKRKPR
jgi:hypothetical protein